MGLISLPTTGVIYVDAQIIIYTVEKHPTYSKLLHSFWKSAEQGSLTAITSELTLLELRVAPLRISNHQLLNRYDQFMAKLQLIQLDRKILLGAAQIRANFTSIKTPDAIHAATAQFEKSHQFLTNDRAFRNIPALNAVILDDIQAP